MKKLILFLLKITVIAIVIFITMMTVFNFTYNSLTGKRTLLTVECTGKRGNIYNLKIETNNKIKYEIAAKDEIFIKGTIIEFNKFLNVIGIRNFAKVNTISNLKVTNNFPRFLHNNLHYLPLIVNCYDNSIFRIPEVGQKYQVYATNGGLSIKPGG